MGFVQFTVRQIGASPKAPVMREKERDASAFLFVPPRGNDHE
jgi:hypothetical protein